MMNSLSIEHKAHWRYKQTLEQNSTQQQFTKGLEKQIRT